MYVIMLLNWSMSFPFSEATKITLAPSDVEMTVGENTVLHCSASFDPSFDITFIWTVDSYIINFATDYEHYEQLMVRMKQLCPDHGSQCFMLEKKLMKAVT